MNRRSPRVLVVGIGEVGRYLLEFIARDAPEIEVVAGDVDRTAVEEKVNNAVFGAALHDRHPLMKGIEVDLFDVDRTAALLAELKADVVVNCAVLQTWHVIRRLPDDLYGRLSSAGLGAWLPVQLTLALRLAEAIDRSGVSAHFVNTSLSDLTNPVLKAAGHEPTIGIGNVALIQSAVRSLLARRAGRPREAVEVTMVAHHVHWVVWREAGYREGAPFFLKASIDGRDVTPEIDALELMKEAILLYPGGTSFSAVSASSAIANVKALLSEREVHTHSPGPNGLPGGYPVVLSAAGAAVNLPEELPLAEAVAMNERAHTFDGVREIEPSGRAHFMPYAIDIMRELLGFDCESFVPEESEELAREQMRRFGELEARSS